MPPHVIARDTEVAADSRNAKTQSGLQPTLGLMRHQQNDGPPIARLSVASAQTPSFSLGAKCFDAIDILP